ncbi:MAG TPA: DUF4292 domain-containing protein [Cytophagales bacterium]|nr:DUF4292 domain-containing protein [Cytophagales bacterium]
MNNLFKLFAVPLLVLLLFSACHRNTGATTQIQTVVHKKDSCELNFKYNNLSFNYFSGKGRLNYQDQNNSISANFHIRIRKDSLIWISVSQLGIEGARFIITKDSILGINKLNKEVYAYSIAYFSKLFNMALDYNTFERVLVGNMVVEPQCSDTLLFQGNFEILKRSVPTHTLETYINGQNLRMEKFTVVQQPLSNTLNVNYSEFEAIRNIMFGYKVNASIKYLTSDKRVAYNSVYIEYHKIDIDEKELKFPFNIPNRFR